MKNLPTGMQNFKEIIEKNYLYVDKTGFIHKITSVGKYYFLSRPRRFGKTLLVSTMEELFKGNEDLFKNLYIHDKWDWGEQFPVIHLDFSELSIETPEKLENTINDFINSEARENEIKLYNSELTNRFSEIIKGLSKKYKKKVVILIDEYDKAIIKNLDNIEIAEKNRDILSSFYQVLKANDKYLRFVFLTGVSKFSKTSLFSELNNLTDLTLKPLFANICGYTQEELEICFKDHVDKYCEDFDLSREEFLNLIKNWYNGYSWDGKNFLYNPYSILNFFEDGEFSNYWFESGSPTFLIDLIMNNPDNVNEFLKPQSRIFSNFPSFNLKRIDLNTVLLQTGYLTIKEKKVVIGELPEYFIDIPNKEVHYSFYSHLLSYFTKKSPESIKPMAEDILKHLISGDDDGLTKEFQTLINNMPAVLHQQIENINEAYYHLLFSSWLQLMGFEVSNEDRTLGGDADAVLHLKNLVIIIEYKYSESLAMNTMLNKRLDQIKKQGYYKAYENKDLIFVSIATKPKEVACKIEKY